VTSLQIFFSRLRMQSHSSEGFPHQCRVAAVPQLTHAGNSAGKKRDHAAGRAVCEILACLLVGTRLQPTLSANSHPQIYFLKPFKDSDDLPARTQLEARKHPAKGTRLPHTGAASQRLRARPDSLQQRDGGS